MKKKQLGIKAAQILKQRWLVIVISTVVLVGSGIGAYVWYTHTLEKQLAVSVTDTTEKKDDIKAKEPEETLISNQTIVMSGESIEKDLKIKFADMQGTGIISVPFQVIVVPTAEDQTAEEWETKQMEIEQQYENETKAEEVQKEKEETYVKFLQEVKGITYSDDDQDGYIYIDGMESGDYNIWYVPVEGYTTDEKNILVHVKEQVEYVAVDVSDKVESYSASEDVKRHNVTTEAVQQDTVEWQDSFQKWNGESVAYQLGSKASIPTVLGGLTTSTDNNGASLSVASTATVYNTSGLNTVTLPFSFQGIEAVNSNFSVTSGNVSVVSAAISGNDVVVTADETSGPTTITVTNNYTYRDESQNISNGSVSVTISVVNGALDTPLQSAQGQILYMDETGKIATVKNYDSAKEYYIQTTTEGYYIYTGWQTIDGKVYFFDGDGNKVTGDQIIAGTTYHFSSDGILIQGTGAYGIDVSKWLGDIDWQAVKNAGISYAIIRCGGRYQSGLGLFEDPKFVQNVNGANAVGIRVGIYFYSTAISNVEAVEEASFVLSLISGKSISYPVFIDVEDDRQSELSKAEKTSICITFCEIIKNGGYTPGVYANKYWMTYLLDMSALNQYCIWVAQYNTICTYTGKYDIWQHTSKGKIPGIDENVDMDISYLGY